MRQQAARDIWIETNHIAAHLSTSTICWTNQSVAVATESWDYGDALGGEVAYRLVVQQGQYQSSAGGTWQTLPMSCNYRSPFLESIFKCAMGTGYISLYTER